MARFAVNELTTFRWTFDEDIQQYLDADVRAVGIWRQKLSDIGEDKGLELVRDSNVLVSSLSWAGGFTGSDGRTYKEAIADGLEAVRMAAALQAGCLIVYTGGRAGHTHNHAKRLAQAALAEVVAAAETYHVTLAVEPMHSGCAAEWTFLTDLDQTLGMIDAIDSPRLKLVLDTFHFGREPTDIERLKSLAPHVALVQLGDSREPPQGEQNRCRLGDGSVPLREIIASLSAGGYDGFYELELMGEELEAADYGELLRSSKQTFESLV